VGFQTAGVRGGGERPALQGRRKPIHKHKQSDCTKIQEKISGGPLGTSTLKASRGGNASKRKARGELAHARKKKVELRWRKSSSGSNVSSTRRGQPSAYWGS